MVKMTKQLLERQDSRKRRKLRVRKRVIGTPDRPRLSVFRSNRSIYAQVIDDISGSTLLAASSDEVDKKELNKTEVAEKVGELVASRAKDKKIEKIVFDRGGYLYHGRIKALAEGARKGGLDL